MNRHVLRGGLVSFAIVVACAVNTRPNPKVGRLGPVIGRTSITAFGTIGEIRPYADGRVLVHQYAAKRLVIYDASLSNPIVISDTTAATNRSYRGADRLLPYPGDSTLVLTLGGRIAIIDRDGREGRTVQFTHDSPLGGITRDMGASVDSRGRIYYERPLHDWHNANDPSTIDTAVLLVTDLSSRETEPVAFLQRDRHVFQCCVSAYRNVLMSGDAWAVLWNGAVGVVRVRDYHIDWTDPDGVRHASHAIPHEWKRLTDADKAAIKERATRYVNTHLFDSRRGVTEPGVPATPVALHMPRNGVLPDSVPPLQDGQGRDIARPDAEGNIWLLTEPAVYVPTFGRRPSVYDVVDRNADLIGRIELPENHILFGLGPGVAYIIEYRPDGAWLIKQRLW